MKPVYWILLIAILGVVVGLPGVDAITGEEIL
jgi:hypothetical protein